MIKKIYYTDRLELHLSNVNMAKEVADYVLRNKEFLLDTDPLHEESYYTEDGQRAELQQDEKNIANLDSVRFWIKEKDTNKIIGMIALNGIVMGVFQSCFLSYKLDKDYLNRGYMTEAAKKIIEIAFKDVALHRIEANIMPRNKASLRVVEKLNFKNEGLAKKYLKINGVWEDHIHMVLLNE